MSNIREVYSALPEAKAEYSEPLTPKCQTDTDLIEAELNGIGDARKIVGGIASGFAKRITPIWEKLYRVDLYLEKRQKEVVGEVLR